MRPRLRLTGISKAFGATQALSEVSLEVAPGEVHALIGENGAGKSTLMKVLSGVIKPDAGNMELDGKAYRPADTLAARRHGVAMIYQELSLAPHLSVWENIVMGDEPQHWGWLDHHVAKRRAREVLSSLAHEHLDVDLPVATFPIAEQQIIEIARALLTKPQVLIMDEPTSSLTQQDTARLFMVIRQLQARGVTVIYISHFLEEVRQVAHRFTVLKDGQTVGSGEISSTSQDEIVRLMVGREVTELYPQRAAQSGDVVFALEDGLKVHAGEILGIGGLIGAGRTELLRRTFGLDFAANLDTTPRRRWAEAVGFLSENRKEEGLMLPLRISENVTLPKFDRLARWGWLSPQRTEAAAQSWIVDLGIKARDAKQRVDELSGGNQQKVALARLLEYPAKVLLLDEPTRGIDVGSKAQIYELIVQLAAQGRAVILVSSYLPELFGLCDRIAVMRRGAVVECRPTGEWTEQTLMRAAIGTVAA
ncbi:MAG: sugar ABC transporter ATP-binding protein [Cephaloticoccus sp.]|nr:sugar ABC transporter ATP-binding protein [Cephaloticoccus sp.]MCF7760620.1 sugar ABC transporter ATP-binding protein [Cephaloticoccus sp.]